MADYNLLLITGDRIHIVDNVYYKSPKLKEILQFDYYKMALGLALFYDIEDTLLIYDDIFQFIEKNKMSSFVAFNYYMLEMKDVREYVIGSLKLHFKDVKFKKNRVYIDGSLMTKNMYVKICEVLKETYGYKNKIEENKYSTQTTKMYILKNQQNKRKRKSSFDKNEITLFNIISAVNIKMGIDFCNEVNFFQLLDAFQRINKEKQFDGAMQGVCSGKLDSKVLDSVNWIK